MSDRTKFCQTSSCSTALTCFILASYHDNARKPPFWHTDFYNVDTYSLSTCSDSHVKGLYDCNRLNCNTNLESLLCRSTCTTFWICIGHSDWQDFDFCQTFEFFISKTDKTGTFQEHCSIDLKLYLKSRDWDNFFLNVSNGPFNFISMGHFQF